MGILKPLRKRSAVDEALDALSTDLNLTDYRGIDSAAGQSLIRLQKKLHQRIQGGVAAAVGIAAQAPALSAIAHQTMQTGSQLAQSSEAIASSSEQVTTAIESELIPATTDVARLSASVAKAVRNCETDSEQAENSITQVSTTEQHLAQVITSLQGQLDEVVRVISSISNISRQTNLLALNAAIEAARAGEHGRGFAVVAEEVRSLANTTTDAASQVATIIESFKTEVSGLGRAGEQMQLAVSEGASSVRHIRSELGGVRQAMDDLDQKVHGIAASTEQMGMAMSTVNRDVHTVSTVAADMQRKAAEVGERGHEVHRESDRLLESLGSFRLQVHTQACDDISRLAQERVLLDGGVSQAENLMHQALGRHAHFELMYLVGADGKQISENIFAPDLAGRGSDSARGKDWNGRAWFRAVVASKCAHITDVYRSAATDDFCFTISVPIVDDRGRIVRVLGADARLSALLN
ncbi:methyl-accepting chemotaxis protein [Pseudohongiella acticola]|jgi:methyl-accepting chemotaxis protein|uniref:methyl-accepting chemotaxis protein n=1 Tax=Pseudohongiella acticola TaxID=1524254 RepID=UPI0030EEBE44